MARAEAADTTPPDDDDRLPNKIVQREVRKAKPEAARRQIKDEAREQDAVEHWAYA